MPIREALLELLAEDVLSDHGFLPGLKPRGHEAVLGDALIHSFTEDNALTAGEDGDQLREAALLDELTWRQREEEIHEPDDEQPRDAGEDRAGDPEPPAPYPSKFPEEPRAPEAAPPTPEPRRLADARREVEAFEARNRHQTELKTLLILILDHISRLPPSDLEHWWAVARVYRRVLAAPEMATSKAWAVLSRLLDLRADQLTKRRLEHVLGRRKPKPHAIDGAHEIGKTA